MGLIITSILVKFRIGLAPFHPGPGPQPRHGSLFTNPPSRKGSLSGFSQVAAAPHRVKRPLSLGQTRSNGAAAATAGADAGATVSFVIVSRSGSAVKVQLSQQQQQHQQHQQQQLGRRGSGGVAAGALERGQSLLEYALADACPPPPKVHYDFSCQVRLCREGRLLDFGAEGKGRRVQGRQMAAEGGGKECLRPHACCL